MDRNVAQGRSRSIGRSVANVGAVTAVGLLGLGVLRCKQCESFRDLPGVLAPKDAFGRTVNGMSSLVTGIVAQRISPTSEFHMTVEKPMFGDARVSGETTSASIRSRVDVSMTSAEFTASKTDSGFAGEVAKSEFNWEIRQIDQDTWEVGRFGWKLDSTLRLTVADGHISGTYERALAPDWTISGRYSADGLVAIDVSTGILEPSFRITGKVDSR